MSQYHAKQEICVDTTHDSRKHSSGECLSPRSIHSNSSLDLLDSEYEQELTTSVPTSSSEQISSKMSMQLSKSSLALLGLCPNYNETLKIRTLTGAKISIPVNGMKTYRDMKEYICRGLPLSAADLRIISRGGEMKDDQIIDFSTTPTKQKLFVLVKTSSHSPITLKCKFNGKSSEYNATSSTRIFHLKRELYIKKITSLRSGSQRLIIGGRQVHDNLLLGDYLLQSVANQKKMFDKDNHILLHISKTMNIDHEVDVKAHIGDHLEVKFQMEISIPTIYVREILFRQYGIPKENKLALFLLIKGRSIELHPDFTLIDYGITAETKSVDVVLFKVPEIPSVSNTQYIAPLPSEAFLLDEKVREIEEINSVMMKPSSDVNASVLKLPEAVSLSQESISKKRPIETEKSNKSTAMFKGIKKGFFEKSSKPKRPKQISEDTSVASNEKDNSFSGLRRGFLSSPSKNVPSTNAKK